MVRYHPDLVSRITLPKRHQYYSDQAAAITAANKSWDTLGRPDIEPVPQDFGYISDDEDDDLKSESEDDREPESENKADLDSTTPERKAMVRKSPKGRKKKDPKLQPSLSEKRKKRRRSAATVSSDVRVRPGKKKRTELHIPEGTNNGKETSLLDQKREEHHLPIDGEKLQHLVNQLKEKDEQLRLERQKRMASELKIEKLDDTILELRRVLRQKETLLEGTRGDRSNPLRIVVPTQPPCKIAIPEKSTFGKKKMADQVFTSQLAQLKSDFADLKKKILDVEECRRELVCETRSVQHKFSLLVNKVVDAETLVSSKERDVCVILKMFLEAGVDMELLRETNGGTVIRSITKQCREVPTMYELSDALLNFWMTSVEEHIRKNPDLVVQSRKKRFSGNVEPSIKSKDMGSLKHSDNGSAMEVENPEQKGPETDAGARVRTDDGSGHIRTTVKENTPRLTKPTDGSASMSDVDTRTKGLSNGNIDTMDVAPSTVEQKTNPGPGKTPDGKKTLEESTSKSKSSEMPKGTTPSADAAAWKESERSRMMSEELSVKLTGDLAPDSKVERKVIERSANHSTGEKKATAGLNKGFPRGQNLDTNEEKENDPESLRVLKEVKKAGSSATPLQASGAKAEETPRSVTVPADALNPGSKPLQAASTTNSDRKETTKEDE